MTKAVDPLDKLIFELREREKELKCLYEIEEIFNRREATLGDLLRAVVRVIPSGLQSPESAVARIVYGDTAYESPGFRTTAWTLTRELRVEDEVVGSVAVAYTSEPPHGQAGAFLDEERRLLGAIADRMVARIVHEKLKSVFGREPRSESPGREWRVILDLLRRTDPKLLTRVTRKMLNQLSWGGVGEAEHILESFKPSSRPGRHTPLDENRPAYTISRDILGLSEEIFAIAAAHMADHEILANLQKWIKEDRSGFLVRILESPSSSLAEIASAIERFHHLSTAQGLELSLPRERGFRVALIRRLLSDHPQFINIAKSYIDVGDFFELLHRVIYPAGSHGRMGGKGAGILLAERILTQSAQRGEDVPRVRTPKTWYLTSDGVLNFINYNDLEEIVEQKYEEVGHVRHEYPYIVHLFKNSPLPPEMINGLSVALDDFGEKPLIVRSSSLLEDRMGTSFAGKYKSLFIANQGNKRDRLIALMDAITEVYASLFGPDPIEYRIEHSLVDFHEEMGILIQEVVGTRIGRYFLPAFAGVAFTNNEMRWSKRLRREDGLLRMVPGLGTRAVDRMSDDYPILVAPGQPTLRPNVTRQEILRYSPRLIDVINLETNSFETIEIRELFRAYGSEYPMLHQLASVVEDTGINVPTSMGFDPERDELVVTFDGLVARTPFIEQMRSILRVLQNEFNAPVDVEFAHDGTDLYLLQCRPQSFSPASQPAVVPKDIAPDKTLFTANRYISNGAISGITHIVYVDPASYAELTDRDDLLAVGTAVSRLNQLLPKRQFILMGPGRWGSRGDIRLGVSVTYSDINNTSMLIEIARKRRDYVPELSFGTHFFQDLVEAGIRYLPLYPDEDGNQFNEEFLLGARNTFADILPEFERFAPVVRVIDVVSETGGRVLQVLMNGETDEAIALFAGASIEPQKAVAAAVVDRDSVDPKDEKHWRWRFRMAERLANVIDAERFGVRAMYLFGSTKNATARPDSDIDILLHFDGTDEQRSSLLQWLDGWSMSLSQMNFLRTGYKTDGLLDLHLITDEDIRQRTSFAAKIGAATDAARALPLGRGRKAG